MIIRSTFSVLVLLWATTSASLVRGDLIMVNSPQNIPDNSGLGIDLGAFHDDERDVINILQTEIQPAHLQIDAKRKLNEAERDVLRAEIVRRHLKNLTEPCFDDILDKEANDE